MISSAGSEKFRQHHSGTAFADKHRQALAFVYCEDEPGRRAAASLLTRDEARRVAATIAKLLELLKQPQYCFQLHNSLGGGNDPQGLIEGLIVLPLLEAVPPVTPDPADPALDPDVALDLDVAIDP